MFQVESKGLRKALSKLESVESALREHPLARYSQLQQRLATLQQRQGLETAMQVSSVECRIGPGKEWLKALN
jgi:hypothetical protein